MPEENNTIAQQEERDEERDLLLKGLTSLFEAQQSIDNEPKSPLMGGTLPTGYGSDESLLRQRAEESREARRESVATMQGILDERNAELRRRAEEASRGLLTDEQLDRARRSSTLVSGITSALANIANGIAVSRGAMNATVPEGYSAAYQHWSDVEKRARERRKEYDKIIDSINQNMMQSANLDYTLAKEEEGQALSQMQAIHQERTRQAEKEMEADRRMREIAYRQDRLDEREAARQERKGSEPHSPTAPKAPTKIRRSSAYGGSIDVPEGMTTDDVYDRIREAAVEWINDPVHGVMDKQAKIDRINNASTNSAILTAINDARVPSDVMRRALPTTNNTQNQGNGRQQTNRTGFQL